MDVILNLYMLFLRLEQERDNSKDGRTPIVYYALDVFGKHLCSNRDSSKIMEILNDSNKINEFVDIAGRITKAYLKQKQKENEDLDYNHLIKIAIDYRLLDDCYDIYS